ncbi:hypothetical protein BX600DRAFT_467675 [Xylariales sp. PMI_506]|nr:hypothetical protein BX600DRAFT_467675 [Xylariales sp. PMI_506]
MGSIDFETPTILGKPPLILDKSIQYKDFRDELRDKGFVVLKGVVPKDRAAAIQTKAYDWLRSFGTELNFDIPETWTEGNLPISNRIRAYAGYCVSHEKFMWDARTEPGVLDAFSTLWGTDELLVSFDCLNITFPNRADLAVRKPWEHVDQSPRKRGLHCVQGIINLSPSGPDDGGLVVFPNSNNLYEEFFDSHPEIKVPPNWRDVYLFNKEELRWFEDKGLRPHKVCAEVGDLILWDSRTVHYGSDPTEKGRQIRTAIYATYMPASMATAEQLAQKKHVFEHFGTTTHWPYEHLGDGPTHAKLPDGTRDPQDRDQPLELPEMSDKLLKLAGAMAY